MPPPEPKLVETTELPPGKKKCTETAHAGADAIFSYTIKYLDGSTKEQDFRSRYKPWGEVCLIGVKPEDVKQPAGETFNATSTQFSDLP